ncbi:ParB N-terminal domain-containing protein [Lewinella sp. IMCC34191]|uniref:ParB N-terminal domain-containing protein n=1 Tax=Lewinella sp. IMCC34191 TaxID=2259172 RepID=UPI000E21E2A9|nr:ParB N-terminal domain-containing protein [Lewinella sp. IMCC34191]
MEDVKNIAVELISLDTKNPRISEFGVDENTGEDRILEILYEEMSVNEILLSIVSNGFWQYEPLILLDDKDGRYTVIEGNRRIAAIKLIHDSRGIQLPKSIRDGITPSLIANTSTVPAIVVEDRRDAWKFIGFKHVNGPAKWGSYAKARYIAEVHNEFGISLNDVADQIGDTNRTAQKLYQGLMVLEQAKKEGIYNYTIDIQADRLYFSHLYTGLQREGIRNHIDIADAEEESTEPIPKAKLPQLKELLQWLYGSKSDDIQPVIKSQNPDLKYLDSVLRERESLSAIRSGESLEYSYELSRATGAVFEENLLNAKRNLQKTKAYITNGYDGDEQLLRVAGSVANLADSVYEEMEKIMLDRSGRSKKKRISD